mgnify:FL=1
MDATEEPGWVQDAAEVAECEAMASGGLTISPRAIKRDLHEAARTAARRKGLRSPRVCGWILRLPRIGTTLAVAAVGFVEATDPYGQSIRFDVSVALF